MDGLGGVMERELLKLATQLTVVAVVAYVVVAAAGKAKTRKHKDDPTQFPQTSRVWVTSGLTAEKNQAASVQPQSLLY